MRRTRTLALAIALALGCDGGGTGLDGGVPTDGAASSDAPLTLAPCPDGWREVLDEETGVTWCDPWPAEGPAACGRGEAHVPGTDGCAPLGQPCPSGEFGDPPAGDVVYVAVTATGGDGTAARPYGDLSAAVAAAPPGATVLLSKGSHVVGALSISSSIALRGACAAQTDVLANGTISIDLEAGEEVALEELRVYAELDTLVRGAGTLRLSAFAIAGSLDVDASVVTMSDVQVDSFTAPILPYATFAIRASTSATVDRLTVVGLFSLAAVEAPRLEARDLALTAELGFLGLGGDAVVERLVGWGFDPMVQLVGDGVMLSDAAIWDTQPEADGPPSDLPIGFALGVADARGELERISVQGAAGGAIVASGTTDVSIESVYVRDVRVQMCGDTCPVIGIGVAASYSGRVRMNGFRIHDVATCGVMVAEGGELDLARGEITGSTIGACVQIDGYDLGRLSDGVRYQDNGSNLDSTTLPVPQVPDMLPL